MQVVYWLLLLGLARFEKQKTAITLFCRQLIDLDQSVDLVLAPGAAAPFVIEGGRR